MRSNRRMKTRLGNIITIIVMSGITLNVIPITVLADQHEEIYLESAIQIAIHANHGLKVIQEKVKVAEAHLDGIALLSNPELETEFIGGDHSEQVVELTKTFELGGQRGHRKQIAKINLEKANLELIDSTRLLTKSVKTAFFQLVLIQEKLKLAKGIIKHNQQMYDLAQFQFESGDISVSKVSLANIQLQSSQREFASLESDKMLAQLELNGLLGTSLDSTPTAIGGFPDKSNKKLLLDSLKSHALTHRADLKSLKLNRQLTENRHKLAKASIIPDLSIGGIAEHSAGETGFGVKFSLPIPLFDRNRVEINTIKVKKELDTAEVTNTQRQIIREVMSAYITLSASEKTLKFYDENMLKLLNDNLTLMRSAYELGEVELLELILIQNEFIKTRFAYLDALATYHKSMVQLESALGTSINLVE